ncbi:uncharacterized protein [Amphiura filiformis]|uniref:uncharacterized protein n=1 Tax=Amphiura filiformis TaxID=82378 RepID=UPI003B20BEB7
MTTTFSRVEAGKLLNLAAMANISNDLKSYLSGTSGASNADTSTSSSHSSLTSWFSKKEDKTEGETLENDPSNAWFNEAQKDPLCPSLSKRQRILGFMMCLLAGAICFAMALSIAPFIVVRARKFALLYSLGSLFTISSFSLLWGPWHHVKHLCSSQRLPFTAIYFGTMFATLYFAMVKKVMILTIVCAIFQIIALFWYIVSYIPGGQTGLKFFTKIFSSAAKTTLSKTLPV